MPDDYIGVAMTLDSDAGEVVKVGSVAVPRTTGIVTTRPPRWVEAKDRKPPTAADFRTTKDGPQSDPLRTFAPEFCTN